MEKTTGSSSLSLYSRIRAGELKMARRLYPEWKGVRRVIFELAILFVPLVAGIFMMSGLTAWSHPNGPRFFVGGVALAVGIFYAIWLKHLARSHYDSLY